MADTGSQYKLDDAFKARARLFQSCYRAEVLAVDYQDYGNRLTDLDAQKLLNYYENLNTRETLRSRYPKYSRKRDADLLRSEHIPFNLLAPLDTNRKAACSIIQKAWGIECAEISAIKIEYAPTPKEKYLNDGTAFDAYIQGRLTDGTSCGIGIEVKYTEQAYPIGKTEAINISDHGSPYWETARASDCFINPDHETFGSDAFRQIWRNHLLGLSMVIQGGIDSFYSITLFPNGNEHFHKYIPMYVRKLKPESRASVFGCTFEKFISSIEGCSEFNEWRNWLERRYLMP